MSIRTKAAALAAGAFEDVAADIGGSPGYGATNVLAGKLYWVTPSGTAASGTATYTRIAQSSTSGSGTGATFTVSRSGGAYTVIIEKQGLGYAGADTITINGASLGGTTPTNNLTMTVPADSAYGYDYFPWVPDYSASVDGSIPFATKAHYSFEDGRRRIVFCATNHNSSTVPPGPTASSFMIDLDTDIIHDMPVPHSLRAATYNTTNAAHEWGVSAIDPGKRKFIRGSGLTPALFYIGDIDKDDPTDIDSSQWTSATTPTLSGAASLAYFPERHALICGDLADSKIYERKDNATTFTQITAASFTHGAGTGTAFLYNPVHSCIWFGGGNIAGTPSQNMFRLDADGTVTQCSTTNDPDYIYTFPGTSVGSVIAIDPASGKGIVINRNVDDYTTASSFVVKEYDFDTDAWTTRSDIADALAALSGWLDHTFGTINAVVPVSLWDLGVIGYMARDKFFIYKHTANTMASGLTLAQKAKLGGNLSLYPFTTGDPVLKYSWDQADSSLNAALTGQTHYGLTQTRGPTEGNTVAYRTSYRTDQTPVSDMIPQIDGTNGLRFTIPSESYEGFGYFQMNIDGVLHSSSADEVWVSPASNYGSVLYCQFEFKADAAFFSNAYRQFSVDSSYDIEAGTIPLGTVSCTGGSATVTAANGGFIAGHVGRTCIIRNGTNFIEGQYTIQSRPSANTIVLDRTPTNGSNASGGEIFVAGDASNPALVSFEKLFLIQCEPPNTGQQSSTAFGNYPAGVSGAGNPQVYSRASGFTSPSANTTLSFVQDAFQVITIRIELRGTSNAQESRMTWWVNGVKTSQTDWQTAQFYFDGAGGPEVNVQGLGQFQIDNQMTHRDPNQTYTAARLWYRNVIFSRQPIPYLSSDAAEPPPVTTKYLLPFLFQG